MKHRARFEEEGLRTPARESLRFLVKRRKPECGRIWLVSHRIMRLVHRMRPLVMPASRSEHAYSTQKPFLLRAEPGRVGAPPRPAHGQAMSPSRPLLQLSWCATSSCA